MKKYTSFSQIGRDQYFTVKMYIWIKKYKPGNNVSNRIRGDPYVFEPFLPTRSLHQEDVWRSFQSSLRGPKLPEEWEDVEWKGARLHVTYALR